MYHKVSGDWEGLNVTNSSKTIFGMSVSLSSNGNVIAIGDNDDFVYLEFCR